MGFRKTFLTFSNRALVGKFMGMWPSPKSIRQWVDKAWKSMMKGNLGVFAVGNGHFVFLFECKEDKDIVFQNGPYFLDQVECI